MTIVLICLKGFSECICKSALDSVLIGHIHQNVSGIGIPNQVAPHGTGTVCFQNKSKKNQIKKKSVKKTKT